MKNQKMEDGGWKIASRWVTAIFYLLSSILYTNAAGFFAVSKPFPDTTRTSAVLYQAMLVVICISVVTMGLLLWAAFVRKRSRRSSGHSHHSSSSGHSHQSNRTAATGETGTGHRRRRHRRRRSRSPRYPQNPTLAQTGGLPPIRRDEPPPPPQQQTGTQSP